MRTARLRTPSPSVTGEAMSRPEPASAVNAWLNEHTDYVGAFDERYVGKMERGCVRWPGRDHRAALRAVLRVHTDAELGFRPPRRQIASVPPRSDQPGWLAVTMPERRQQLAALLIAEHTATRVTHIAPLLIPGVLQTADVIRSIRRRAMCLGTRLTNE